MNKSNRRLWIFGVITIAVLVIFTLAIAPSHNMRTSGSTYSRSPDGYGAWYAFMEARGTPVRRWQKPLLALATNPEGDRVTLLRVYGPLIRPSLPQNTKEWIERGNTLIVLGVRKPVTQAPFTTTHNSAAGTVKIETRRRERLQSDPTERLSDEFGAVVWEEQMGEGRLIGASAPYLAANAYQDEPGNYEFLAQVVAESENPIWVDEYIHGYRDPAPAAGEEVPQPSERPQGWIGYLARTPWLPVLLQVGIILLVAIVAGNRRFGSIRTPETPTVDNSQAYIQALAGVLRKARSSQFVLDTVGRAEQIQLQKALGLGSEPIEIDTLAQLWAERTGRRAIELKQLLEPIENSKKARNWSESKLLSWLEKMTRGRGDVETRR
ncbi:MAG: DUF4350 domain-containing protein [Cyanobacteriota bacterium]|nr:DUF4350 domain-containing protein [Cyanobacteriota bacterium]